MKPLALALLLSLLATPIIQAGGTVDWDLHALPLLQKHPELLAVIQNTLDVSPTGTGPRLGRDAGEDQGQRIPPFTFPARLKGASCEYNLLLVIHDPSGAHESDDSRTGIEIRPK